jgi:hypothetical protein
MNVGLSSQASGQPRLGDEAAGEEDEEDEDIDVENVENVENIDEEEEVKPIKEGSTPTQLPPVFTGLAVLPIRTTTPL